MKPKPTNQSTEQNKQTPPPQKPQAPKQQKGDNLNFVVFIELVQFFRSQDPRTPICKGYVFKEQNGTPSTKERADVRVRECRTSSQ